MSLKKSLNPKKLLQVFTRFFRNLSVVLVVLCIIPQIAKGDSKQDTLFLQAEKLKAQLLSAGSSSYLEREALKREFTRVCNLASYQDFESYIATLYRFESLVRDISDSYEFLEIIRDSAEEWKTVGRSISELSEVYQVLARINARLQDHKGAYSYLDKIGALPMDSLTTNQLANYYFFHGYLAYFAHEYEKAVSYLQPASNWSLKSDDLRTKLICHNALSHCHNLLRQFDQGHDAVTKAFEILEIAQDTTNRPAVMASLYINLAESQHGIGKKVEAYQSVEKAQEFSEQSNLNIIKGNTYWIWSRLLRRDYRLDEAKFTALQALSEYKLAKDPHYMLLAMKELVKTSKAMKDYSASLQYTEQYHILRDSLNSAKLFIESNSAQLIRESENQQAELALLKEKNARQQVEAKSKETERIGLIIIALFFGLLTFSIYQRLKVEKSIQSKLESEVARRTEALRAQAQRLKSSNEELERFAYIASHDLKTPIRNIVSFLTLIERRLPTIHEPSLAEFIRIASDNARHMHGLITDVLEFSKLNADIETTCESFDLSEEIGLFVDNLEVDKLDVSIQGGSTINAPRKLVMQLVQNIIDNGVKYNNSDTKKIEVSITESDGFTTLQVKDNGIGIEPQYKEKIFELFKRLHTNEEYEGTGLGLAMCKKITDRVGGEIEVESVLGEGSVFTIKMPNNCTSNIQKYKEYNEALAVFN